MIKAMNNTFFDYIGGFNFLLGSVFGVFKFVANINFSVWANILTVISLTVGILFILMKAYDQYLITKKRKKS